MIANLEVKPVELCPRQRTLAYEIALARFNVYLQEQSIYPLIPDSSYTPFDVLGVSADMQIVERYAVFAEIAQAVENVDKVVLFGESMTHPQIMTSDTLKSDMSI